MLSNYRRLFAVPHVLSLLLWSLVARFYMPGQMIAVSFLVVDWTGSYTYAGVVAGALPLGMALVAPWRGRMADRGGSDRLVLVCGAVFAAGLVVLALLPASLWWLAVPLALGIGVFGTPANQIVRALWPRLTRGPERQAIYAAEATTQELLFVFSPILTAGVVAYWGPRWSLLLLALLALAGSIGFALALRRAGVTGPAPVEAAEDADTAGATSGTAGAAGAAGAGRRRSLVLYPVLSLLFMMCLLMICGIIGMDLVIVAWANELDAPEYVMVLAAVWALGSLVGGMVSGTLKGPPHLVRRCFATTLGLALVLPFLPPITHLPTPLLATPVLFLAGLAVAPTLAAVMGRIGDSAPPDRRAEAFGWLATAMGVGGAIAGPLAGGLIDGFGIAGGAAATVGAMLVASVMSLFAVRGRAAADPVSEEAVS